MRGNRYTRSTSPVDVKSTDLGLHEPEIALLTYWGIRHAALKVVGGVAVRKRGLNII
jgi:hypothetical protein